jgi:hypothetical protein
MPVGEDFTKYLALSIMQNMTVKRKTVTVQEAGRRGGKARAKKYDKATLSRWAKKGGRPKGSGKKEK